MLLNQQSGSLSRFVASIGLIDGLDTDSFLESSFYPDPDCRMARL